MVNIEGKVALVTGGSKGIGASICKVLASEGVKVVINYNSSKESAQSLVDEIKNNGGEADLFQCDVSEIEEAKVLVENTINKYGRLDFLINNAGITRDRSFRKLLHEDWNKVIAVNLSSVYNTTNSALPHLLNSECGRIINISSIIGQSGGFGQTNYAAAKAGIIGFTKSLALELAKTGVTVNSICPGFIETKMVLDIPEEIRDQIKNKIPQKRFGKPEEIAKGVLYLIKDGDYITGQQLNINGGLYM
ncbi:MAG: beta-ketoacyl-ACP reductase [Bacillales bacterium]|jgi:acetoacetyl-CoA reductase|nr:beta-ketoacyl-ACP reductase [Bacillales bacterium]